LVVEKLLQQLRHESAQLKHQLAIVQQQLVCEHKETDRQVDIAKKQEEKIEASNKMLAEKKGRIVEANPCQCTLAAAISGITCAC